MMGSYKSGSMMGGKNGMMMMMGGKGGMMMYSTSSGKMYSASYSGKMYSSSSYRGKIYNAEYVMSGKGDTGKSWAFQLDHLSLLILLLNKPCAMLRSFCFLASIQV